MKGRDYITHVYEQLVAPESIEASALRGAFLRAALSVIGEVKSPIKEETLVSLAILELDHTKPMRASRKRAA
jgi:hypothetical protein